MKIIDRITGFFHNLFRKEIGCEVLPSKDYAIDLDFSNETWVLYYKGKVVNEYRNKNNAIKYCWDHHSVYSTRKESTFSLFNSHKIIDVNVV